MCLALPARIVAFDDPEHAVVDLGGVQKRISTALTPEVQIGSYVIVHVGYAIGTLDPDEAQRTLALFGEVAATKANVA